jgi:RNA polymerase sigma-70 factor (ECF subfamily)
VAQVQPVEDIQLIQQSQQGDTQAFGDLYERYAPRVFRYLYAHLDNRLDAEDLTEEVFLRVWKSLGGYQEQGVPFLAFLFRVARNALIDHYRRSGKNLAETPIEDMQLREPGVGPVEAVTALLEHQQLRAMLEELREDYRTVLVLRFLSELSPEETARAMGRSAGAVRVLQHRALAALRSMMDSGPGEA